MQMNNESDFYREESDEESSYERKGIFGRDGRSIFQSPVAFPLFHGKRNSFSSPKIFLESYHTRMRRISR